MWLLEPFSEIRLVLENRNDAIEAFILSGRTTPRQLFYQKHTPALLTFPAGILLSPFTWMSDWKTIKLICLLSIFVLFVTFILAFVLDKITENAGFKNLESPDFIPRKNIALFTVLPITSVGIFYFLHPWIGFIFLLLAFVYNIWNGIHSISLAHSITRLKALTFFLNAITLLFIPLLALATLVASWKTIYYIYIQ